MSENVKRYTITYDGHPVEYVLADDHERALTAAEERAEKAEDAGRDAARCFLNLSEQHGNTLTELEKAKGEMRGMFKAKSMLRWLRVHGEIDPYHYEQRFRAILKRIASRASRKENGK